MSSNAISGYSTRARMTGLSGLDTETMIQKLMQAETAKLDKVKQQKQLLEWKRDDYRSIINSVRVFKDEYFDVLKPANNFRSSSIFASYNVTSSKEATATAKASVGAIAKEHTLVVRKLATAYNIQGTQATSKIEGSMDITDFTLQGKQIRINLDGTTKTLNLEDYTDIADLDTKLQAAIDSAFGAGKIDIVPNGNKIEFQPLLNGSTISISESTNSFISELGFMDSTQNFVTGSEITATDFSQFNGDFKVDFNGTVNTVSLSGLTSSSTLTNVKNAIQTQLNAKYGSDKINVSIDGNKLVFQSKTGQEFILSSAGSNNILDKLGISSGASASGISSTTIDLSGNEKGKTFIVNVNGVDTEIEIDQDYNDLSAMAAYIQSKLTGVQVGKEISSNKLMFSSNGTEKIIFKKGPEDSLEKLGFTADDNTSNKVSFTSGLAGLEKHFTTSVDFNPNANVSFKINNVTINLNKTFANATLNDVMNAVNNSDAGVELKYDTLLDKFTMTSKTYGIAETISYVDTDPTNGLLKALGISGGTTTAGTDAEFDLDGVTNMKRNSNEFTIDGVTYSLKAEDPTTTVTVKVEKDATALVEKIKGFVKAYNTLIDTINTEYSEKRNRSYAPLTDDQKESLSESDIEKWEEKAKAGLLKGDSLLSSITSGMRLALYESVKDVPISLSSIGITTSSYLDKGKLIIDDEKLTKAIEDNSDAVAQLFTNDSQYSYEEGLRDSSKQATRYSECGLAQRLYDIIQDNIRTIRDNDGKKGVLLEKAGMIGDLSEIKNTLYDEIEEKDDLISIMVKKLTKKEEVYYTRFSALETALNKMNSQSAWLAQQFGSSQ